MEKEDSPHCHNHYHKQSNNNNNNNNSNDAIHKNDIIYYIYGKFSYMFRPKWAIVR